MKPNINDRSTLPDLKRMLAEKNVSPTAINTIERALKKGMTFRGVEDLTILNIPALDVGAVGELVDFGTTVVVVKNIKTVEYRFLPVGDTAFFFGYQLVVAFLNKDSFTTEEYYPIEDGDRVLVDFDLNDLLPGSVVTLRVNTAVGERARIRRAPGGTGEFTDETIDVAVTDLANQAVEVEVTKPVLPANPEVSASYPIRGKVLSTRADSKMDGYQVVIFAATGNLPDGTTPAFAPVAFATTETNGYFVTSPILFENSADLRRVTAAKASVSRDSVRVEIPIQPVVTGGEDDGAPRTSMLPERVILVIEEPAPGAGTADGPPECACTDLNFQEKKVLEEFSYYTVVRTSEPSIIADVLEDQPEIDLQDIYGVPGVVPLNVFRKFHAIQSGQPRLTLLQSTPTAPGAPALAARAETSAARDAGAAAPNTKAALFNRDLLDQLVLEHKVNTVIRGNAKPVFKGRVQLNQANQIDWDDEPTIYQAASIAHGHLLHFKQEWIADGYSIGDLVYSLPLAPGQKKQIAVLDWERRESAANSQALEYEETLNNSLARDRDISEVVSGTLTENIRANSKSTTGGIGFGLGGAVLGAFSGGTFGALLGISGGKSSSGASANQSSFRESTANSLQSISDRTQQAASVVRSQRATVVQTVSQGEQVQATAESVANYNHCHAITIQYFEVLRHFAVRTRLADVQECLFVPLQMGTFDTAKCLRWRTSLERHLLRRDLLPAFDALARIQSEKESPFENYYDSIGFPRKNFAEQAILSYSGEMLMEFFFFNTNEEKIDDAIILFYTFFGISLDPLRDRKITDEELAQQVGPRAIEFLLDAFTVETDKGVDLKLDLTLVSTFRQNTPLRISLRQGAATRTDIPRDQISAINIKLDLAKLAPDAASNLAQFQNKYMKIRLRSASLRYRTDNFAGSLIDGRIDNDIFAGGDGAFTPTPLTREELRNPRGEDVSAANNLIRHLNENLEYYHKCLFFDMTPERRFMLLDGIIAPGKANGRSVASVVENRVIGIAGNSLIMPVAPGYQLDPTIDETFDLFAQYYGEEPDPIRISVPTKGIYAEAVMGKCNSCEVKDESRFWRWEESPIPDSPNTQILPLNTDTRRADPGNLQPKDFPTPVVNIQNAPNVPDPTGLQGLQQLLGKSDAFRDLTGLNQTQLNSLAAFQKSLDSAQSFGKDAADLAKTAGLMQLIEDAQKNGSLSNDQAKDKAQKLLDSATTSQESGVAKLREGLAALDKLQSDGALTPEAVTTAKQQLLKGFLDGSTAKSSLSSGDIQDLSTTASKNNTDISFKKDGEALDIKKQPGDTGLGGNTTLQTLNLPNLVNHQGYHGRFQLRATLNDDASFRVELVNNSFDFVDFGPIHARNETHITLKSDSPPFGSLIPSNPRSTTLLYEGVLSAGSPPSDVFPTNASGINVGIKLSAAMTKSALKYRLPFRGGLRIPCVQGRNTGTHTNGSAFALDLGVPRGTEVLAAMDGVVVDIVTTETDLPPGTRGNVQDGNIVRIRHADLTYAVYGHLQQNGARVTVGQQVTAGTLLALSGNSGNTDGDHLHFAVEKATDTGFETVDFDFFDSHGNAFVPAGLQICEAGAGVVTGKVLSGNGDPEGAVAGDQGDLYVRLNGPVGQLYYAKESGAPGSNTGWRAKAAFP